MGNFPATQRSDGLFPITNNTHPINYPNKGVACPVKILLISWEQKNHKTHYEFYGCLQDIRQTPIDCRTELSLVSNVWFVVDKVALEKMFLQLASAFPCYSSFHHCSILM
jgi:hypothetical protein